MKCVVCAAEVTVKAAGEGVRTGKVELGQGILTALGQIAADAPPVRDTQVLLTMVRGAVVHDALPQPSPWRAAPG